MGGPKAGALLPGVHKIRVPLIDSPLGWVNSYVIQGDEGFVLVDCGSGALAAARLCLLESSCSGIP